VVTDRGVGVRRIVITTGSTAAGIVLLLTWSPAEVPTAVPVAAPVSPTSTAVQPEVPSTTGVQASPAPVATKTWTGGVAQTRWGPVQVRITVRGKKIVAASAVQVPAGNHRDQEINDYAVPVLDDEAVAASSASIDAVSGATVTSDGYVASLQSALDAAGLA
jgi:uncharacterized protein with FMN-binding domain